MDTDPFDDAREEYDKARLGLTGEGGDTEAAFVSAADELARAAVQHVRDLDQHLRATKHFTSEQIDFLKAQNAQQGETIHTLRCKLAEALSLHTKDERGDWRRLERDHERLQTVLEHRNRQLHEQRLALEEQRAARAEAPNVDCGLAPASRFDIDRLV